MVFKKLASFIYNYMSPRRQLRIKDVTSYEATALNVSENSKDGELTSPGGSCSAETAEAEGEFCCVCLSRLKGGENMRVLPCMHRFHRVCIDRWFNVCRKTCPVCRFAMGQEERTYKREEQLTEEMVIWFSSFHVAGF
ncbi:nucleic acid binding protein, putative [Ricinus communis]|uniref:RING-type E3 ubiquitin transferase n=1 Tax=Ricinus communis TaxID=3988 RepID=B9SYS7_RICCO|nr:nucleic acid binding protein, putative [Ricinus communis]|eukprot:XP_002531146.1 E3 ubiquitin-protein ligase RHA2A [Ricinus communis]